MVQFHRFKFRILAGWPPAREKSAFATSLGLFQFTVMSFWLTNSSSTFERLMEDVLRGLQWTELCFTWMISHLQVSQLKKG